DWPKRLPVTRWPPSGSLSCCGPSSKRCATGSCPAAGGPVSGGQKTPGPPPPGRGERSDAIWASARRVSDLRRGCSHETEPLPADLDVGCAEDVVADTVLGGPSALLAAAVATGVLTPRHVV